MASNRKQGDGGCFGAAIALAIVVGLIFIGITTVGDLLGLTPSVSEISDRPDGWVTRHYQGVVLGYMLTVLFLVLILVAVWLAIRTQSEEVHQAENARVWLSRVGWTGGALVVAMLVLPVGKRDQVDGNVPRLVGMTAAQANAALDEESLDASFREIPPDADECEVVKQYPRPGAELDAYEEVNLRCAVDVPRVVGRNAERAEARLYDRGFDTRFVNEPRDFDLSRCRVRQQSRSGTAPPNSNIALRLRCHKPRSNPQPAPADNPVQNCDPNYAPCVPPYPPDVNCDDIVGSVAVIGEDVHALDDNDDAVGCE